MSFMLFMYLLKSSWILVHQAAFYLYVCHFSKVSLRWWEHLQLPAQPPELTSQNTLCCRPLDLGSARVAWLPREPVAPGGPQLEGHGGAPLLLPQYSMHSYENI